MNTDLRFTVRRIDGCFRVVASDPEWIETEDGRFERNLDPIVEHTHEHPFTDRREAWRLIGEIRLGLEEGRDLDLRHWQ